MPIFDLECPACGYKETKEVKPIPEHRAVYDAPTCPNCFCNMMAVGVKNN